MVKCEYPNCNKIATVSLRVADFDCKCSFYCKEHAKIRKMELYSEFIKEAENE